MNTPNSASDSAREKTRLGRNPFEKKAATAAKPNTKPAVQPSPKIESKPEPIAAAPRAEPKPDHEWQTARHWITVELPAELMMLGLETAITVTRGLRRLNRDRIERKDKKRAET